MVKPDIEMINFMIDIAELASMKTRIEDDKLKPYISFREAARLHGAAIVKRWHDEGLIEFLQDGPNSKIRIERIRIEAVAKASNRATYLTTKERDKH